MALRGLRTFRCQWSPYGSLPTGQATADPLTESIEGSSTIALSLSFCRPHYLNLIRSALERFMQHARVQPHAVERTYSAPAINRPSRRGLVSCAVSKLMWWFDCCVLFSRQGAGGSGTAAGNLSHRCTGLVRTESPPSGTWLTKGPQTERTVPRFPLGSWDQPWGPNATIPLPQSLTAGTVRRRWPVFHSVHGT